MSDVLVEGFNQVMSWVSVGLLAFALCAFVNAAVHREDAYRAADKQSKAFWLIILGVAAAVNLFMGVFGFLPILGLIATIVYVVDVRPALKHASGGRGPRRGGSSSDGPYGPYNGRR
ncbi:4-amino-4-deoxy-L-arabinose transferase-like glycosyltransferase [Streptomyces eurocidicus]|uniref:4-amino-4-deoxy-L-arabinose transferase-like glycosyltransferase n=1 Tax=Streptomyces eurocidicus TaxID=66423 RepID=A0A7W8B6U6_STREU|nr:4-amino-4-deoxy-L-arabinose transferase-like glycosyltransferase [Streptomyces eurocidicus]